MQVLLLGPVQAVENGGSIALAGAKQRAVLAMLALEAGRLVSRDRLVDGLWEEPLPPSAPKMIQQYVWQLRKLGVEIVTHGTGYALRVDAEAVDALHFERLLATGAAREALALWRGPPLADVAGQPFAAAEVRRLDELRGEALELAIEAEVAAGRAPLPQIEAAVAEFPLRERLHAQRMLALYRSGRQADALEAYHAARATLIERIGVEPGSELRRLQRAILRQDAELDLEPRPRDLPLALDTTAMPPLVGRDPQLDRLRALWARCERGTGALVGVIGAPGMGKTRLAAELAAGVVRRATVLYATQGQHALDAVAAASVPRGPTLLVVDEPDDAARAAVEALIDAFEELPVLVMMTATEPTVLGQADELITLLPLDAAAVGEVVRLYGEPPSREVLAASQGVPRRVHALASQWARAAAERRIANAASEAAAGRGALRAIESELADGIVDLQRARERTRRFARATTPACPFKGLVPFEGDDAEFFFGRERLVATLVARVATGVPLALVGPSGSGKSSVLRAGLIPALRAGVLPGSDHWNVALLRPGSEPLLEIERVLQGAPRVIAVDQFEELFAARGEKQAAFIARLLAVEAIVVIAVRADFYGRCAVWPELGANQVLVGAMRRDELRRAVERPAAAAGLQVERDLADALVDDVGGEPAALPLLSTALLELWERRDGQVLRVADYERTGGVRGAVARLAEGAFAALEADEQRVARAILLRLAEEGEDRTVVRRRVPLAELDADRDPLVRAVLDALGKRRLLTLSDGVVEVGHEALLREWPRLRRWLEEDAEGRRVHRRLAAAAGEWDAGGRDSAELYRGAPLAAALDWADTHAPELNALERSFLSMSRAASERAQRRLRTGVAVLSSLLAVAVVAGAIALAERGRAKEQARTADAQRLGAAALVDVEVDRSLLLARQGVALEDTAQTRGNLLAALLTRPAVTHVLRGDGDRIMSLALTPDGRRLAFGDNDGTLLMVNARTRASVGARAVPGAIADLLFSPDGERLAVGSEPPLLLDGRTGEEVARLDVPPGNWPYMLAFSPDGGMLYGTGFDARGRSIVHRHDGRTGAVLAPARRVARALDAVLLVTRDGRRVVTTSFQDGETVIRDARSLRALRRLPVGALRAALAPDDRTMIAGGQDGAVRFVDLDTGRVRIAAGRHDPWVTRAAFSADGRTAVTAGADGSVVVWDVARAAAIETLQGHSGRINALALGRDGSTLYTAGFDGKLLSWDLSGTRRLGRPFLTGTGNHDNPRFALSSDGRVLAAGNGDGSVTLVDTTTLSRGRPVPVVDEGPVYGMGFVPRTRLLVVGAGAGFLALLDTRRGRVVTRLRGHRGTIYTPSFSGDGRRMATADSLGAVRVWALPSGRQAGRALAVGPGLEDISLSPDGATLALTRGADGVEIVDAATGSRRARLDDAESLSGFVRFTPDGRFLMASSFEGWARLWSTETWRPATRAFTGHAGPVLSQSITPDGRLLATGSTDGAIRLFDVRAQRPLGTPLPGLGNLFVVPQFSPDGRYLYALYATGRAYRWDVRPSSWARHACAVAGRPLTRSEWADVLPERRYAPACP